MTGLTILIVDDHPIVREGYRRLLDRQPDYKVVAEAQNAHDAYAAYRNLRPGLVLMDVSMEGASGIAAIRHIRQWDPQARILIFTMHESVVYALKAMEAGACGFVTKSVAPTELLLAIAKVQQGQIALSNDIAQTIAEQRVAGRSTPLDAIGLRETEILRLLAEGKSIDVIADLLSLSPKTVHNYRTQIRAKLGATTDAHLVWLAIKHGLVQPDRA